MVNIVGSIPTFSIAYAKIPVMSLVLIRGGMGKRYEMSIVEIQYKESISHGH